MMWLDRDHSHRESSVLKEECSQNPQSKRSMQLGPWEPSSTFGQAESIISIKVADSNWKNNGEEYLKDMK